MVLTTIATRENRTPTPRPISSPIRRVARNTTSHTNCRERRGEGRGGEGRGGEGRGGEGKGGEGRGGGEELSKTDC